MQTLRRELRLKFTEVLDRHGINQESIGVIAVELADAAMQVAGIASREKRGDIMDGVLHFASEAEERGMRQTEAVLDDLERGLHRNIERTTEWQLLAHWLVVKKNNGQDYHGWISWYMSDEWRAAKEAWKLTPQQIKNSWPQAFPHNTQTTQPKEGGGFYG